MSDKPRRSSGRVQRSSVRVRRCSDSISASAGWPEFDSRRKPSGGKELSENKCVMYNCVDERPYEFFNKINKQMAERHL
jgi:hypothetical protein